MSKIKKMYMYVLQFNIYENKNHLKNQRPWHYRRMLALSNEPKNGSISLIIIVKKSTEVSPEISHFLL